MKLPLSIAIILALSMLCCGKKNNLQTHLNNKLPYLGDPTILSHEENGKLVPDTVYPTIPPFSFTNQNGEKVSDNNYTNCIYISDFFFTTCPTICPKMKSELLRVYEVFKNEPKVKILSHTIDPEYDNVEVLYEYASKLQVSAGKWDFVTGNKDSIYTIAEYYFCSAQEAPNEPGGYIHSGALVLIDIQKHIRGMYDGTKTEEVDKLIKDIPLLLNEIK